MSRTEPVSLFEVSQIIDSLPEKLKLDDIRIVSAEALPLALNTGCCLCIKDIFSPEQLANVKNLLLKYYPANYPLYSFESHNGQARTFKLTALNELSAQTDNDISVVLLLKPAKFEELNRFGLDELIKVLNRLRAPGGCPWDAEQTHESIKSSLIEECYEVLDAIDSNNIEGMCEELGDLLLQIVFHCQIETELGHFDMQDVCSGIVNKLIYRHPHVFSTVNVKDANEVLYNWEQLKKKEKHQNTVADSMLAVPKGFPALMRASKIQKKAKHVGFDWNSPKEALCKIYEEADEVKQALEANENEARVFEEIGDLLFSVVNVARLAGCDAELALKSATEKFLRRFIKMEQLILDSGLLIENLDVAAMDSFWEKAKEEF